MYVGPYVHSIYVSVCVCVCSCEGEADLQKWEQVSSSWAGSRASGEVM